MKTKLMFVVSLMVLAALFVGCSTTPKVMSRTPAATGYQYGAEPNKTVVAPESREYKRHVRESHAMSLAHERNLAAMEYRAKEEKAAKELGVQAPPAPAVSDNQRNWGNGGQPIPWSQAPGNMPVYQPAPLPPPVQQMATDPYGYGYSSVAYARRSWGPFNFGASIVAVSPPPVYYSPYSYPQRTVVYHQHHTSFGGVLGFGGGRHHGHGRHR